MRKYIIIYHKHESDDWHLTNAENPKEALLNIYKDYGGSRILNTNEFQKFIETFDLETLIKLFEKEHYKIAHIGEFIPVYGEKV